MVRVADGDTIHAKVGSRVEKTGRLGFAQVMTIPPNVRYRARFLRLQRQARAGRRGLWGRR